MKRRVLLGLGSNLGDRRKYLRQAIDGLPDVVRESQVYETEPVGGPEDQGAYLNMCVELFTDLSARGLLERAKMQELRAERVRTVRNGPRTLDVDVLWIDGEAVDFPDLQVPHPRMWERRFVLAPLAELAPDIVPDGWDKDAQGAVVALGKL